MARSSGYVRLATGTTRTLAEKAFDLIREAVVVVDMRSKHLPLVLANSAARACLGGESEPSRLIGSSLFSLLGAASASVVQSLLTSVADSDSKLSRSLTWRLDRGEAEAMTELKLLDSSQNQRLVMMTFAPSARASELADAGDQLPLVEPPGIAVVQHAGTSEGRLRALFEETQDIITVAASDGQIKYVSGNARSALGYPAEEMQPRKCIFDYVHPDDVGTLRAKFRRLTSGSIGGFTSQHRMRHHDGSYRWLESSYVAALDNPLINGVVATSRDITERKQAEIQLAQREEVFRLAAEAVDGIIFEWDLTRGIVHRSRGLLEILGIEPEDLAPVVDSWRDRIHPGDVEAVARQIGLALIEGRGWTVTYRIRDARGRYRSMLERSLIQRNSAGDPMRAIGCCVDVSEIKRLTDLLGEAQRTAKMGGWEYSYSTLELAWTDEMFRIFETSPEKFVVSWDSMLAQCTPESRERFHTAWRRADLTDGQLDLEVEISTLENRRIWIRVIGHIEKLDGRPVRAFGSVQNIQAQKVAQIALENSTDWLKLSMNIAHLHAWRWDKSSDRIDLAIVGGPKEHLPQIFPTLAALISGVHPDDRAMVAGAMERAFNSRGDTDAEFRLKLDSRGYRFFATFARPLFDADGNP